MKFKLSSDANTRNTDIQLEMRQHFDDIRSFLQNASQVKYAGVAHHDEP